jgi:HK97 family phage major capsid protein
MPYNSLVSRTDVQALIPEEVSNRLLGLNGNLTEESAILRLGIRVPMATNQTRMPALSAIPLAYFVGETTGSPPSATNLKQTAEAAWENKFINVEEIAVIIPIPDSVLEDSNMDLNAIIAPHLETAIGRTLDNAMFFGVNKPVSWPTDIVANAVSAGNTYVIPGTLANFNAGTSPWTPPQSILTGINDLMADLEADGHDPSGVVADRRMRTFFRDARDTTGQLLLDRNEVYGLPVTWAMRGLWPTAASGAKLIVGDFSNIMVGIRRDITYRILDQAIIQDNTGAIMYNLAQQDMVAIRVTFRVGVAVSNMLTFEQPTEASRYPFAVMRLPAA